MSSHAFLAAVRAELGEALIDQDSSNLLEFGRDWTRFHDPKPLAIAFPRTTEEVSKLLRLCQAHKIAVVPSGGRTGLSGGAVAASGELVLSLSKLNFIGDVDPVARTVTVGAGAVTEAVHKVSEQHELTWPVDFASKGSSTVGGNIATNAGGVKVVRFGLTRDWVMGLKVVLMDGTVLDLNGALIKNNTGYDLRQLFIGSEGTLGIITEATLKLTRAQRDLDVFLFGLDTFDSVLKLFAEAQKGPFVLSAYETLSHPCLESVMRHRALKPPFSQAYGAYVVMEVERPDAPDARERLESWLASLFDQSLVLDGTLAQSSQEFSNLWSLREGISESLAARGLVHKNDISLPVSQLVPFMSAFSKFFESDYAGFEVFVFGHIGDGNLHLNILKPEGLSKEDFVNKTKQVDARLFELLKSLKGSVSAEHGIGLLKKHALSYSRSPEEIALFKGIKQVFDPSGLLNPGKIF